MHVWRGIKNKQKKFSAELQPDSLALAKGILYWDDGISLLTSNNYCKFEFTSVTKGALWSLIEVKSVLTVKFDFRIRMMFCC